MKAYQVIARSFQAYLNCVERGNEDWGTKNRETIERVCRDVFPHGSGIDGPEITLDLDASKPNRLVFGPIEYHHMNDGGYYDGWTEHTLVVTPDLAMGFDTKLSGRDRDGIKDYLYELLHYALSRELDENYNVVPECVAVTN